MAEEHRRNIVWNSVDNLILDTANPRLPASIKRKRNSQQLIIDWLLRNASVLELMESIGAQGYFEGEPLLVTPEGAPEGSYVVVEGNGRLAACMLLRNPGLAISRKQSVATNAEAALPGKIPGAVPCVVFAKREEILTYLGYKHITGVNEWDALQKARYLDQIRITKFPDLEKSEQYRILAREIGSGKRSDYVAKLLTGLKLYDIIESEDFFGLKGVEEDTLSFSLLTTALSYKSICKFLGLKNASDEEADELNIGHLRELTAWLFEQGVAGVTRLGESRNLRSLAAVVEHDDALREFRKGSPLDEAELRTSAPAERFRSALASAKADIVRALEAISLIHNTTDDDIATIKEIHERLRSVNAVALSKLSNANDLSL